MDSDFPEPEIDPSTEYRGKLEGLGDKKVVYRSCEGSEGEEELEPASHISPGTEDSFDWGYGGRGPLTTAMTVLEDAYNASVAREHGRDFMENFLSRCLDQSQSWTVEVSDIPKYLERR